MFDLKIVNGTVVSEGTSTRADVAVEGGKIVKVEQPGLLGAAREVIDAEGLHVLPGAIDVHFHCRAPSHPERGDFSSESAAAAAGGVTTIFEMPISNPACSTPEVLANRRALGERDAYVNFALYSGAAISDHAAMAAAGAIGFKLFTLAPAPGREPEFQGLWANDEGGIYAALEGVATTGLPCVIHAENESLIQFFAGRAAGDGVPQRPPVVEAAAIASVAAVAQAVGARIHIAHVSSQSALAAVRGARALGADVTAETCPQYLTLDSSTTARFGGLAKMHRRSASPPTPRRSGRGCAPASSPSSRATTRRFSHTRRPASTSPARRRACRPSRSSSRSSSMPPCAASCRSSSRSISSRRPPPASSGSRRRDASPPEPTPTSRWSGSARRSGPVTRPSLRAPPAVAWSTVT